MVVMQNKKKKNNSPERKSVQTGLAGAKLQKEYGGPGGPEPTRYGDWERKGRCVDF